LKVLPIVGHTARPFFLAVGLTAARTGRKVEMEGILNMPARIKAPRVMCPHCSADSVPVQRKGTAFDVDVAEAAEKWKGWFNRLSSHCGERYWVRAEEDGWFTMDPGHEQPTD
jgi:hypothetical protein